MGSTSEVRGYAEDQCRDKTVLGKDSSELRWSMEGSQDDSCDGFQVSCVCVNIAKDEYIGHKIHRNTLVDFRFWFSRLSDRKIKQRSFIDSQRFRQPMIEWRTNPLPCSIFRVKLHVPRPTHVAHEAACTPSSMHSLLHTLELHVLPLPGLRIKICLSHNFGIIINYYSQGLNPPKLNPSFQPFSHFSLTHPVES
jgi:hypothetical protein